MKNILIIGAGDFQLPLAQRASLSYNVLLAAPVISDAFKPYIADSLLIDVRDKEAILDYAKERSICGVITDQTDIAVRLSLHRQEPHERTHGRAGHKTTSQPHGFL